VTRNKRLNIGMNKMFTLDTKFSASRFEKIGSYFKMIPILHWWILWTFHGSRE